MQGPALPTSRPSAFSARDLASCGGTSSSSRLASEGGRRARRRAPLLLLLKGRAPLSLGCGAQALLADRGGGVQAPPPQLFFKLVLH